jgi:hypothetical protein
MYAKLATTSVRTTSRHGQGPVRYRLFIRTEGAVLVCGASIWRIPGRDPTTRLAGGSPEWVYLRIPAGDAWCLRSSLDGRKGSSDRQALRCEVVLLASANPTRIERFTAPLLAREPGGVAAGYGAAANGTLDVYERVSARCGP